MVAKGDNGNEPLSEEKHPPGHHPNQVRTRFRKGVSGNPAGRPPGIPNMNQELLAAIKRFKIRRGKQRKRFFDELVRIAFEEARKKRGRRDLLFQLLEKALADATPKAGAQVNVNSNVNNEHSLHQTILADPRVRQAALDLEERIGASLADPGGNGTNRK